MQQECIHQALFCTEVIPIEIDWFLCLSPHSLPSLSLSLFAIPSSQKSAPSSFHPGGVVKCRGARETPGRDGKRDFIIDPSSLSFVRNGAGRR